MRFLHSIRWRLQLWHGVMLALVLAGFGWTAWRLERATQLQRVDQELERRVAAVADALRRGGTPDWAGEGPPPGAPPPPPPPPRRPPDEQDFYYVAWGPGGGETLRSAAAPAGVPHPERVNGPRGWRTRGRLRELFHFTPGRGDCILVGRDIGEEQAAIRRFGWLLSAAGGTVFVLGLAGGWWISGRALRPIARISATAARISTGDLAQRIPTEARGSELDDLAGVLNDTFARLQSSFARQAQFTADAAHELRTPVAVVLSQAQTALARERPVEEYRESLAACQRAAQRMRRLIESLLTLARLDARDGGPPRNPCALDQVAAEAVDLLLPLGAQREVAIVTELAPARCHGDPEQLGQVVANLVGNAVQHSRAGGTVRVRLAAEAAHVVLEVSDAGEGIAPENLPHVFERFYRADGSRSHADGRTGLGLAIVKAIVERHGGTVEATSARGTGSTFVVRLPRAASQPAGPVPGPKTEPAVRKGIQGGQA